MIKIVCISVLELILKDKPIYSNHMKWKKVYETIHSIHEIILYLRMLLCTSFIRVLIMVNFFILLKKNKNQTSYSSIVWITSYYENFLKILKDTHLIHSMTDVELNQVRVNEIICNNRRGFKQYEIATRLGISKERVQTTVF